MIKCEVRWLGKKLYESIGYLISSKIKKTDWKENEEENQERERFLFFFISSAFTI